MSKARTEIEKARFGPFLGVDPRVLFDLSHYISGDSPVEMLAQALDFKRACRGHLWNPEVTFKQALAALTEIERAAVRDYPKHP